VKELKLAGIASCSAVRPTWRGDIPTRTANPFSLFADGTRRTATKTFGHCPGLAGRAGASPIGRTRALYQLDMIAAKPDAPIAICEGEKAADAGARIFPNRSRRHRAAALKRPRGPIGRRSPGDGFLFGRTMTNPAESMRAKLLRSSRSLIATCR
jgi:hypothetical protein